MVLHKRPGPNDRKDAEYNHAAFLDAVSHYIAGAIDFEQRYAEYLLRRLKVTGEPPDENPFSRSRAEYWGKLLATLGPIPGRIESIGQAFRERSARFALDVQEAQQVAAKQSPSHGIRAGEAFRQAMESDPEAWAGWERARARLQALATAMQALMDSPEYKAAQAAERRQWQALADAICETLQAAGDELAGRHFARPETIDDWEHLARIVEIPAETIRTGNLTAREIFACALAWSDRQTIKAKLAAEANGGATKPSEPGPNTGGTSAPGDGNKYDVPQIDEYDDRVAWWIGKRIYLGRDTQVARLFWLLAKPVGRARTLAEVQRAVEDMETNADAGSTPEEIEKAAKRLRKVVSKLKAAMREAELDDHFVIHRGGSQREPEYSFVPRFASK